MAQARQLVVTPEVGIPVVQEVNAGADAGSACAASQTNHHPTTPTISALRGDPGKGGRNRPPGCDCVCGSPLRLMVVTAA